MNWCTCITNISLSTACNQTLVHSADYRRTGNSRGQNFLCLRDCMCCIINLHGSTFTAKINFPVVHLNWSSFADRMPVGVCMVNRLSCWLGRPSLRPVCTYFRISWHNSCTVSTSSLHVRTAATHVTGACKCAVQTNKLGKNTSWITFGFNCEYREISKPTVRSIPVSYLRAIHTPALGSVCTSAY